MNVLADILWAICGGYIVYIVLGAYWKGTAQLPNRNASYDRYMRDAMNAQLRACNPYSHPLGSVPSQEMVDSWMRQDSSYTETEAGKERIINISLEQQKEEEKNIIDCEVIED